MPYRLAGADRVERLLDAYDTVRSREHELTEFFWEAAERMARGASLVEGIVPAEHMQSLVAMHAAWASRTLKAATVAKWTEERLGAVIGELEAYRSHLDLVIGTVPTLEHVLGRVGDSVPEPRFKWGLGLRAATFSEGFAPSVAKEIHAFVKSHDPVPQQRFEGALLVYRYLAEEMPVVLAVLSPSEAGLVSVSPDIAMSTTVSQLVPRMKIRPETWGDAVLSSIGRRDVELGVEELDSLLHIVASAEARPILSSDRFQRALRVLVRRDIPSLTVENGLATVRWRFEPDRESLDAATTLLRAIRRQPSSCRLLRVG